MVDHPDEHAQSRKAWGLKIETILCINKNTEVSFENSPDGSSIANVSRFRSGRNVLVLKNTSKKQH